MKKKILSTLTIASALSLGVIAALVTNSSRVTEVNSSESDYTLTLNAENAASSIAGGTYSVLTTEGNALEFGATAATVGEGRHISLGLGGTLYSNTKISGIKSITVTFTGALNLTSYVTAGQDGGKVEEGALVSGETHVISTNKDAFLLTATAATDIASVVVRYSCNSKIVTEDPVRYEAENSFVFIKQWDYGNYSDACFKSDANASGGKFVGDVWEWVMEHGAYSFNHYAFRSGEYTLRVRYGAGNADHGMHLAVNGVSQDFTWGAAPGWNPENFANKDITVTLHEGWNRIELGHIAKNWLQLDYFEIIPAEGYCIDSETPLLGDTFYSSAVNVSFFDDTKINIFDDGGALLGFATGLGDVEGNGYVIDTTGMNAGTYTLSARVFNNGEAKTAKMWVNGTPAEGKIVTIPAAATWTEVEIDTVTLQEGVNNISLGRNGIWCNIDGFRLTRSA